MMSFLHVSLLCCMLNVFSSGSAVEDPSLSTAKVPTSSSSNPIITKGVEQTTNILLQSKDGGLTWQDISQGLPEIGQPEDFFAGEAEVYLRVKNVMYRSKSNLQAPVWEKENVPVPRTSIAFNRSGVMAFKYDGQVYQKMPTGKWVPIYTNFNKHTLRTIFETSSGTIFIGSDNGLFKSADRGQSWKLVQNEGGVMDMVETKGVLMATGQNGIMRSTDQGEHWEWVISEGGVGIAIEQIEGGFAAISYSSTANSRRIRISMDSGKTWKAIDEGLPPSVSISSIKQMGNYLICGHPDGIFRSSDMGKTWFNVHPNTDKAFKIFVSRDIVPSVEEDGKVFVLYVSGNVLYAVARNSGC